MVYLTEKSINVKSGFTGSIKKGKVEKWLVSTRRLWKGLIAVFSPIHHCNSTSACKQRRMKWRPRRHSACDSWAAATVCSRPGRFPSLLSGFTAAPLLCRCLSWPKHFSLRCRSRVGLHLCVSAQQQGGYWLCVHSAAASSVTGGWRPHFQVTDAELVLRSRSFIRKWHKLHCPKC